MRVDRLWVCPRSSWGLSWYWSENDDHNVYFDVYFDLVGGCRVGCVCQMVEVGSHWANRKHTLSSGRRRSLIDLIGCPWCIRPATWATRCLLQSTPSVWQHCISEALHRQRPRPNHSKLTCFLYPRMSRINLSSIQSQHHVSSIQEVANDWCQIFTGAVSNFHRCCESLTNTFNTKL